MGLRACVRRRPVRAASRGVLLDAVASSKDKSELGDDDAKEEGLALLKELNNQVVEVKKEIDNITDRITKLRCAAPRSRLVSGVDRKASRKFRGPMATKSSLLPV